jgi:CRISPR/Cas system-associated endoribonuclease Cas2
VQIKYLIVPDDESSRFLRAELKPEDVEELKNGNQKIFKIDFDNCTIEELDEDQDTKELPTRWG